MKGQEYLAFYVFFSCRLKNHHLDGSAVSVCEGLGNFKF